MMVKWKEGAEFALQVIKQEFAEHSRRLEI